MQLDHVNASWWEMAGWSAGWRKGT